MKYCKDILAKLGGKIAKNKTSITKYALIVAALFVVSLLVEVYGFGHQLQTLEKSQAGIHNIENAQVSADGSSLTLPTDGKYIQNLELDMADNSSYDITVQYVDPRTNQEVILPEKLEKSMDRNGFSFLHELVFNIVNSPQKITVLMNGPGVSISGMKIDNSYYFNFYHFLFVFLVGCLIAFFVIFRKNIGKKPEYVFFVVAMVCGTLLVAAEPHSFVSWDEAIHYQKADNNSFGSVFNNGVKDIYSSTNSVPSSFSLKEQSEIDGYFDDQLVNAAKDHKDKSFSIFNFSFLDLYNQLGHIPAGLALMFGRIIYVPNHVIFLFGRFANILIYATVVFFAIRRLKTGKMLMATIALFPTAIFLASNYGYDYWVTAFTMLALAYLFRELQEPETKVTSKNLAIIIGAFVLGLGPKAIYFPLMFLVFLLRKEKFETLEQRKQFLWATSAAILFVVGSFMLPFVVVGPGSGDHRGGSDVNAALQVKFILSNPVAYTKILFNFMSGYMNPENAGGFMTFFAYLGSIKGFLMLGSTLVVVAITDKNEYDRLTSDPKTKSWMLVIFLATVALISTALYVSFTPVGDYFINGVQPRYLIPLLFPLLFVIGSSRVKNPFNRNTYSIIIFGVIAFVSLQGIWDLVVRLHY